MPGTFQYKWQGIKDVQTGDQEIKKVNFADDRNSFRGDINCVPRLNFILILYEKASRSNANFSKNPAINIH